MLRVVLIALGCGVVVTAQTSGDDIARGQSLYRQLCAVCHEAQQSTAGQAIRAAAAAPERILEATRNIGAMAPLRSVVTPAMAMDVG